jgi:hypothetical protein
MPTDFRPLVPDGVRRYDPASETTAHWPAVFASPATTSVQYVYERSPLGPPEDSNDAPRRL